MRLIDADALIDKVGDEADWAACWADGEAFDYDKGYYAGLLYALAAIDKTPTYEFKTVGEPAVPARGDRLKKQEVDT